MTKPHTRLQLLRLSLPAAASLSARAAGFLRTNGLANVSAHSEAVAHAARGLARRFGAGEERADAAAWIHDIGLVWPRAERVAAAHAFQIEILPEEESIPGILHQKFSGFLAGELFELDDTTVLQAAGCHSTLRPGATLLDKVVFVADKLTWTGRAASFRSRMEQELDHSLDAAAFVYLEHMWSRRDELPVIHPWLAAAYQELSETL